MLYLRAFGGLTLENGGQSPTGAATQRSRLAILAVLAVAGDRGVSRESLLALFWPENDSESARGALKQALYALRRDLGDPTAIAGTSELVLNPDVIRSDVQDFGQALATGETEIAVALYRGRFLEGVSINGGEFDRWVDRQRLHWDGLYQDAVARLARDADRRGDHAAAIRWWRALAAADPHSGLVAASLMRALATAGDGASALRHAKTYQLAVRSDLDAEPDQAVQALAEQIGRGDLSPPPAAVPASSHPSLPTTPGLEQQPARPRPSVPRAMLLALVIALIAISTYFVVQSPGPIRPDRIALLTATGGSLDDLSDSLVRAEVSSTLHERDNRLEAVRERSGARYVIELAIRPENDSLRLSARVTDAADNVRVVPVPSVATSLPELRNGARTLGERIAVTLASRRDSLFANWSHAAELPNSWAGFQRMRLGIVAFVRGDTAEAGTLMREAAALDSTSAAPLVWEAWMLSWRGDSEGSGALLARVERPYRRLGGWERELSTFLAARNRADLPAAHTAGHRLLEAVPGSEWALVVANVPMALGRAREAADLSEPALRNPGWAREWPFATIPADQAYHALEDFQRELNIVRVARRRLPDSRLLLQQEVKALAGLGRLEELNVICDRAKQLRPEPQFVEWQPCDQALLELASHGHASAAQALARRLLPARVQGVESAPRRAMIHAGVYEWLGDWEEIGKAINGLAPLKADSAEYLRLLALVQASRGDRAGVTATLVATPDLGSDPYHLAGIAALLGDRDRAVDLLEQALQSGASRIPLHWAGPFDRLRGYYRFDALRRPVEDAMHLTSR